MSVEVEGVEVGGMIVWGPHPISVKARLPGDGAWIVTTRDLLTPEGTWGFTAYPATPMAWATAYGYSGA